MASVRLLGDRGGDPHIPEKSDPVSESDEEGLLQNPFDLARESKIPTTTSHRTPTPDFIPKETRDRLREIVLNSPNPRKSLNYFRSKLLPSCPWIDKSKQSSKSQRAISAPSIAIPNSDDVAPFFKKEVSPVSTSRDDERCVHEFLSCRAAVAVDGLIEPTRSAITVLTSGKEEEVKIAPPLSVPPQAAVQETRLKLWNVPSTSTVKALSLPSDVDAKGESEDVRPGTTEVLEDGLISACPELQRRRWRRPFRDKGEDLGAVSSDLVKHIFAGYASLPAQGGAVHYNEEGPKAGALGMEAPSPSRSSAFAQAEAELLHAFEKGCNTANKQKWKIVGVCKFQKWEACTAETLTTAAIMIGEKTLLPVVEKEKNENRAKAMVVSSQENICATKIQSKKWPCVIVTSYDGKPGIFCNVIGLEWKRGFLFRDTPDVKKKRDPNIMLTDGMESDNPKNASCSATAGSLEGRQPEQ